MYFLLVYLHIISLWVCLPLGPNFLFQGHRHIGLWESILNNSFNLISVRAFLKLKSMSKEYRSKDCHLCVFWELQNVSYDKAVLILKSNLSFTYSNVTHDLHFHLLKLVAPSPPQHRPGALHLTVEPPGLSPVSLLVSMLSSHVSFSSQPPPFLFSFLLSFQRTNIS